MTNPHLETPVFHAGSALAESRAVTILMHGRAQAPETMLDVARRIDLPGMAYVAITAADLTWYPKSFLDPIEDNQPRLDFALDRVKALVNELGRPRAHIALLGFSQGACVLSEYVCRQGGRWGALVAIIGGAVGPPGAALRCAPLYGTPVLLASSDPDEWVPPARVRETAEVMRFAGGDVDLRIFEAAGHLVTDTEVTLARAILKRLV